jgi:Terpene cyclase DEP1
MKQKNVYLFLAGLGVLVPYFHFLPWLREHGLDMPLFFDQLHATRVSEFFAAGVFVSAAVVLAFLYYERGQIRGLWWIPVATLFLFGVAVALPLLLYLREGAQERT